MPVHEALRALLFGDYLQYEPESSAFINVFDIDRSDPMEHFTRLLVLFHLCHVSRGHPAYGFIPAVTVERYVCQLGYAGDHVQDTMRLLYDKGYIEAKMPGETWDNHAALLRVTPRGMYVARTLVREFTYVNAVVVDTPIIDDSIRCKVWDVSDIWARLDRAELFLEYLDESSNAVQDSAATEEWLAISREVRSKIQEIRSRRR